MTPRDKVLEALESLRRHRTSGPEAILVLGSGLGGFVDSLQSPQCVPYEDIPWWPRSTAPGHQGKLLLGEFEGLRLAVLQGRVHYYEGYSLEEVTFPIRVLGEWGARVLFATNAAGGIDPTYPAGQWVALEDHINLLGTNPLIGPNEDAWGPRFPDMTAAYDRDLLSVLQKASEQTGVPLRLGVYVAFPGPSFETPAEIRMARTLGASLVGMSTVPEVIVARHMGMRVCALSCVANPAAGMGDQKPLNHEEVLEEVGRASGQLEPLLKAFFRELRHVL